MTMRRKAYLLMGSLVISILLLGCQKIKENKYTQTLLPEEVKIGSILILTGQEGITWGVAAKNGIDLAVARINDQGGLNGQPVKVVHEDEQDDPKKALAAFNKLTQIDSAEIIIGTTWSTSGLALKNIADQNKILMISPSLGVAEYNESSPYLFNTWPHDFILSAKLADYVFEQGHQRVALVGAQQVWVKEQTNAFKKRFEELGGSVELLIEPKLDDRTELVEATKIKDKQKQIDAVVLTAGEYQLGSLVAQKVRELGIDVPLYSITLYDEIIESSNGAYNGLEFLTSLTPTIEFKKQYEDKHGVAIDIGADSAYDAVMMIAQAIRETNSTNTTVLSEYLNNIKEYNGVSGHLVADGKGGFTKDYKLMKVVDGEAVEIE